MNIRPTRADMPAFMVALPLILLLLPARTFAANPQDSSPFLRDYAETRGFRLGRPVNAKPAPDGQTVLFLRAAARVPKMSLYEFDVHSGETRELLTPEQVLKGAEEKLSPEEKARRERMRVSVGGITNFQLSPDGTQVLLAISGKLYLVQRADQTVRELKIGAGNILDPKFSPDGKWVSYVKDHDVWAIRLRTQDERRITQGGTAVKSHGLAEFVAQEEMGRFSGYWWSPDSRYIVYEEADASAVEVWHVSDPAQPGQPPHPYFYPRPGKDNVNVRLGIISLRDGKTVWVQWDQARYPYLAKVTWETIGPLTITVQSRLQNELALLEVDPRRGRTRPLLVERDDAWVNLDQDLPKWIPNAPGTGEPAFLWTSEINGAPQLELRDQHGALTRVLVPLEHGYQGLTAADATAGWVVYRASANPTESHLHRVKLDGTERHTLTSETGLHSATFAKNFAIYTHHKTTPDLVSQTTVHRADGALLGTLPSVAEEPPFIPRAEIHKVETGPGFYTELVRPRQFDPMRRYPVLVDVYGGPLANKVVASIRGRLLDQWLADQGFIIVSIDGRGTPHRGRDWERAIYRALGSVPLQDQVAALQGLGRQFPELDLSRVGIVGWSFGGYMAALAVLKRPDVFHAAVAGAPVADWLDYDTHYTERYLGLPDQQPAAYEEGSLLTYAARLERPLLLIHGTSDDNVFFRHSLKLADALFRSGQEFQLLPLSGFTHMVPEAVVTERLWSKIAGFFETTLAPDSMKNPALRRHKENP